MSFECPLHFDFEAVVRLEEVSTDEQQHKIRHLQVSTDLCPPFIARIDIAVVPIGDQPLSAEQ